MNQITLHEHHWTIATVYLESDGLGGTGQVQVAYLLCQCGSVRRTIVED